MAKAAINLNEKLPCEEDDVENPAQALTLGSSDPSRAAGTAKGHAFNASAEPPLPPSDGSSNKARKDEESKNTVAVIGSLAVNSNNAPVDNIQKKIRRAERFGVSVQLSEEEKRNSRAERFGIGSGMKKPESQNKSEELKRKARAERFGISVSEVMNEEEKKKARLERFASNAKTVSDEEERKTAREISSQMSPVLFHKRVAKQLLQAGPVEEHEELAFHFLFFSLYFHLTSVGSYSNLQLTFEALVLKHDRQVNPWTATFLQGFGPNWLLQDMGMLVLVTCG